MLNFNLNCNGPLNKNDNAWLMITSIMFYDVISLHKSDQQFIGSLPIIWSHPPVGCCATWIPQLSLRSFIQLRTSIVGYGSLYDMNKFVYAHMHKYFESTNHHLRWTDEITYFDQNNSNKRSMSFIVIGDDTWFWDTEVYTFWNIAWLRVCVDFRIHWSIHIS